MRPTTKSVGSIRRSLYFAQTRLGLTGPEGTALLVVSLALACGVALSEFREHRAAPLDPATFYAATDAAFATASPSQAWTADTTTAAEPVPPTADSLETAASGDAVALNTASADALTALPGVGPAIAARIIEERARGPFRDLADFERRVRGIGPKTAAKIGPAASF